MTFQHLMVMNYESGKLGRKKKRWLASWTTRKKTFVLLDKVVGQIEHGQYSPCSDSAQKEDSLHLNQCSNAKLKLNNTHCEGNYR